RRGGIERPGWLVGLALVISLHGRWSG
ncbi:MAG: hypothetical protein QOI92_772, partial [Chloroflexota bacterium]|nr:hypothetical protein [Chloroflexota bacterium]